MLSLAGRTPAAAPRLCPMGARSYVKRGSRAPRKIALLPDYRAPPKMSRYFRKEPIIAKFGADPPLDTEREEKVVTAFIQYHMTDALLARTVCGLEERYIPMPSDVAEGDVLLVSRTRDVTPKLLQPGYRFPMGKLPRGTVIHNLEPYPDAGATSVARASGVFAQVVMHEMERNVTIIKMPSGILKEFDSGSLCTLGAVHRKAKYVKGKAGKPRPPSMKWPR